MMLASLYEQLLKYSSVMNLNKPLNPEVLNSFHTENQIEIPAPLVALLGYFNGGEIFIPGTTIYGIDTRDVKKNIKYANRGDIRRLFHIPNTYLIFAKMNFGDFICINLNPPFDVIQWDHEQDEVYLTWDSIEEWLVEEIDNYSEYEEGN